MMILWTLGYHRGEPQSNRDAVDALSIQGTCDAHAARGDASPRRVAVIDNSDGEYTPIRLCAECLVDLANDELDPVLLAKVMREVRIEARLPMRIKITKRIKDKETDSHTFEVPVTASVSDMQKEVVSIAGRWKGGFEVGTCFMVERLP